MPENFVNDYQIYVASPQTPKTDKILKNNYF
jgi:hypothetical protein